MSNTEKGRTIYYMDIIAEVKRKKVTSRHNTWVISTYNTPSSIMLNDKEAMERLRRRLYNGKTEVTVVIKKITNEISLSKTVRP